MKKIKIDTYTTDWIHGFTSLKEAYLHHLTGNFKVVHIGSTSIPGLDSRPIIDIDIVVSHKGELIDLVSQLTYLGYLNILESEDKSVVVLKRSIREVPLLNEHHSKWLPHHLNICLEDSVFYKSHLSFKNYMMNHVSELESYGQLKSALSHKYPKDVTQYQLEKSVFIHDVLKVEGFTEDEITMVKKYQYT